MRRAVVPLLLTLTALAAPAHAAPPVAPRTLDVSGPANSVVEVVIDRTVRLGNGGGDVTMTTSRGSWSGIVIASRTAPPNAFNQAKSGLYVGVQVPQSARCPGGTCPWTLGIEPPVEGTDDGNGAIVLHRGTYVVALLGPAGQTVHARITLAGARSGTLTLHTGAVRGVGAASSFAAGGPAAGHQTHADSFLWAPGGQHWSTAATYQLYALEPAGTIDANGCLTVGPQRPATTGISPCTDGDGEDVLFTSPPGYTVHNVPVGTVDVGSGGAFVWGPAPGGDDRFGAGSTVDAVAPESWLDVLNLGVSF
jgi:hypothetical protein